MTIIFNKELEILSKEREEGNMRKEEEEMNKVVANFNMTFNEGSFKKGNIYIYKYKDEDNNIISVQTEQGTDIDFTFGEFHTLFSFLTI